MRGRNRYWRLGSTAACLALWTAPALAADGYITAGTEGWEQSAPEAKYQEFKEVARGAFVESFLYRDDLWSGRMSLWGGNAIRSDQFYGMNYQGSRWRLDFAYRQTPHNISFNSRTGYTLVQPANQLLPDSLQRKNQQNPASYTQTMTDFLNVANNYDLGFRTDVAALRLKGRPGKGVQVELAGSRRNRSGSKPYGGSFGFSNAIEAIEPVRQSMAEALGRVSYTRNRVSVEGSIEYSGFENSNSTLIWDNPKILTDVVGSPGKGQLDLYPDNQAWRAAGRVGVQLPRRTAFTGSLSYGAVTQDDKWLPFTVNSAVLAPDTFPLPGTSTLAKSYVTTATARLTSHPVARVGGTLRYGWSKYDNRTRQWTLSGQVPYDGSWNGTDVTSHPFGNERMVFGIDLDWNPIRELGLYGTVEQIDRKHTFREIPEDHETAYEGKVRVKPRPWLQADARYRKGDREFDEFIDEDYQNAAGQFIEQPELRRFDLAERSQELAEASLSWTGYERVTLSATCGYLRNQYKETFLGLKDDTRRSAGVGATISATDRIDLVGNFGWASMYTEQRSRESAAVLSQADTTDWEARLTDDLVSGDAEVTWRTIPDKLVITTSYFYSRSPGIYDLQNYKGTAQDLPATVYIRQGVGVEARYSLREGFDVAGRWGWEQYDVTDFAMEDVPLLFPTTGTSNAIFLGDSTLDYRATLVALAITRVF